MDETYNIMPDKVTFRVSEDVTVSLSSTGDVKRIRSILYSSVFRTSNVGESYRFINNLEAVGLLPNRRRNENAGWRKLNWVEHIYILIVAELRKYGMKTEAIRPFADAFLDKTNNAALISIMSVMRGVEITLVFKHDGTCAILDPTHVGFYESEIMKGTGIVPSRDAGEVQFKLSYFVNKLWSNIGLRPVDIQHFFGLLNSRRILQQRSVSLRKKQLLKCDNSKTKKNFILNVGKTTYSSNRGLSVNQLPKDLSDQIVALVEGGYGSLNFEVQGGRVVDARNIESKKVDDSNSN
jgi:hypothetical protein